MKGLKTKLMSAVAMLTASAVMLAGTSFAWYTLSTNPEVKGITATAVANGNLEIALDNSYNAPDTQIDAASALNGSGGKTNDPYTWGNLIDLNTNGIMTAAGTMELRPAAFDTTNADAKAFKTVSYGPDGRVKALDVPLSMEAAYVSGGAGISKVGTVKKVDNKDTLDTQYLFKVVYWMRTNEVGTVSLSTASNRDTTNTTDNMGGGSTITCTNYGYDASTAIDKYPADAFKVVFKITDPNGAVTYVETKKTGQGVATSGYTLSGTTATIPATDLFTTTNTTINKAYKVEMYIYLDGEVVTNAMADAVINNIAVNAQFAHSAIAATGEGKTPAMKK